ncbi:MAG: TolC family protein [Planctomycetes bacterium]|nr:TolC family protein [Planctomycetota bacterium]
MRKNRYDNIGRWNAFFYILAGISGLWWFGGCGMSRHKASLQADEKVYDIINRNWQDSFGANTNYRLNDPNTTANPNNIIPATLSKTGKLSLADAIQLAVAVGPEYQLAREQLYLTGLEQTEAEHLYKLTPFASLAAGQSMTRESSTRTARMSENEIRGGQATAGISQLLATGAVLTTDLTLGSFDVVSGTYRSGPASIFQAAISQPLLRGANRVVVLETLTQAQRNTLYEIRAFNRFRKTFYVSVADDYYRILKYSRQVDNAGENLLALKTIVQKMETLAKVGMIPQFDLERARQNALKAHDDYSQIRQICEEALDLYKNRLLIPQAMAIELDMNEWYELEKMASSEISISEQQSLEAAFSARLDLANVFDQVEDAKRHVEVAADALGMDLTLVGVASPASHQRFTLGAEAGDMQRTQERYELGLRANLPLDRLAERNNYKRMLIALMQAQRMHQLLSNQVEMEVRKAWRDMNQAKNRLATQKQARELAGKRLDDTLLLMQYGKANATDVLDPQRDYFVALDNYAAALSDFGIAKMKFLRDTEILWINPEGRYEQRIAMEQKQSDLQKQN